MRLETVGLWIAIAAAVGVAAMSYGTTEALTTTSRQVDRAHEAIDALEQVLVAAGAAGSARRAYLLAGDRLEIEKFATARDEARSALARARSLIARDGGRVDRIDGAGPMLERRLADEQSSIEGRREGADSGVASPPPTRAEVDEMSAIRSALVAATGERREVLRERGQRAERTATMARTVDLAGTGLSVAILVLAFTRLRVDATRERKARRAADSTTRFLDSILEHLPAMVFLKDAGDLRFERLNRTAEEILGVSRQELLGKSDWDFFPEEQARFFQAKDRQTLERGVMVDIEEEPIETKGGRRWLHTRKVPLLDDEGRPAYLLGISEDITERKRGAVALKEEKEKAEMLNRELEAFSYSVAHDLRAPLRSIDGFSRALLEDSGDRLDDVGRGHLQRVLGAAERMAELIDDLLMLSRLSRADIELSDVDISALAAESVAALLHDRGEREVAVKIAPALTTRGDRRLLRVVMDNLLSNALKFTRGRECATIEVGALGDKGERVYFVKDDGVGFDERYADKLFGPFQRLHSVRDFPGTGIGLATVQRVVFRHGGRVWARSQVGQGATFSFTLGRHDVAGAS